MRISELSLRRPSFLGTVAAVAAITLIVLCLTALSFRASGGRWFVVRTPSMGRAAPVGTLLLTRPTTTHATNVGDIISFHAPRTGTVYTHRVIARTAAGLRTRGDINQSDDSWVITDSNLIGKVSARWWGMGWVLRGVPLLLFCLAVVWLVAARVKLSWRSPLRVVGTALSLSLVACVLHPWIGLERLGSTVARQGVTIRAVSTGVLPVRAQAVQGEDNVRLVNGQVGSVLVDQQDAHGAYTVTGSPSLDLWWWIAIILVCLSPVLWCLLVGLAPVPLEPESTQGSPADAADADSEDAEADADAEAADTEPDELPPATQNWFRRDHVDD